MFHILLAEAAIGQFARVGHFTIGQFAGLQVFQGLNFALCWAFSHVGTPQADTPLEGLHVCTKRLFSAIIGNELECFCQIFQQLGKTMLWWGRSQWYTALDILQIGVVLWSV